MNDRTYPPPTGPSPYDPAVRRRNLKTLVILVVVLVGAALIPATYRRFQQPESYFATQPEAAQAVERGDVPRFVPAAGTEIHARHNRDTGQRFVRFNYADADIPAITRGMRLLAAEEKEKVTVPTPGWNDWWPITSRTLSGGQGEYLQVYVSPAQPDRGYLALDPRTHHAYFWSHSAAGR